MTLGLGVPAFSQREGQLVLNTQHEIGIHVCVCVCVCVCV